MTETRVALVTGASSGIGRALAERLVAEGWKVAALARRLDRLKALEDSSAAGPGTLTAYVADVTDPATLERAVRSTLEQWGRLDLVVANAGFAVSGPFTKLNIADYRRQFETNVFGVLHTIYATREPLFAAKGILAVVGSVAGHVPLPYGTPYSMSKFSVKALAYGLRTEWRKKGVSVVHVSPGFVETDITKVDNEGVYRADATHRTPTAFIAKLDAVVPEMLRGILSRRREVTLTRHGKVMASLVGHFPKTTDFLVRQAFSLGG